MAKEDFLNSAGKVDTLETLDSVRGFFGKYRCLSNFWPCNVRIDGLNFSSSEAAYMAQKTLDPAVKLQFAQCITGKDAKALGYKIQIRDDWDDIHRIHAMYRVLFAKFTQNTDLLAILMGTQTKYLEESNWWGDTYWGKVDGVGFNHLGETLMTIRQFVAQT